MDQKAPVSREMPLLPGLKERVQNGLLCAADAEGRVWRAVPRPDGERGLGRHLSHLQSGGSWGRPRH